MVKKRTAPDVVEELARAKINLALKIHGKRPDGYHEIETLIAFATIGDRLTVRRARQGTGRLTVVGSFASTLAGDNLISMAQAAVAEAAPRFAEELLSLDVTLDKRLPIAAGLGGGSADAAAMLRAIKMLFPETAGLDWYGLAAGLGADVPACFDSRTVVARGTGVSLSPAPPLPALPLLLVNANAPPLERKTPRVFSALGARPLMAQFTRAETALSAALASDMADLFAALGPLGNDLEPPASRLMPEVSQVLAALRATAAPLVRLSGAGPTGFAIFGPGDTRARDEAGAAIRRLHPHWWVAPGALDSLSGDA